MQTETIVALVAAIIFFGGFGAGLAWVVHTTQKGAEKW